MRLRISSLRSIGHFIEGYLCNTLWKMSFNHRSALDQTIRLTIFRVWVLCMNPCPHLCGESDWKRLSKDICIKKYRILTYLSAILVAVFREMIHKKTDLRSVLFYAKEELGSKPMKWLILGRSKD